MKPVKIFPNISVLPVFQWEKNIGTWLKTAGYPSNLQIPLAVHRDIMSVNSREIYKSKIVYSTVSNNGCSINWRTDWAKF